MNGRIFKTVSGFTRFMNEQSSRGKCWHVIILHDDMCSTPVNNACNCKPWYKVEPMDTDNYLHAQSMQDKWFKSRLH